MNRLKNISWGQGIFIFYVFFVALVVMVFIASRYQDHSLVVDEYYDEDLAYQSIYDKSQRAMTGNNLQMDYQKQAAKIIVSFGQAGVPAGKIKFYRPSDAMKDFEVIISKPIQEISTEGLPGGRWILKVDWEQNGTTFYQEKQIFI